MSDNDEFKVPDVTKLQKPSEQPSQKVIIFCVPGKVFSGKFLINWSELVLQCLINGYRPMLCQEYDKNLFISRNKCLGANLLSNDNDQKPFQGNLSYDYLVWLDPNVLFTFSDLQKLLSSPYDITSGLYLLNSNLTNVVQKIDLEYYKKNGFINLLNYDNVIDIDKEDNRYFEAEFADMGFMLFKKGVIEKLSYPWFEYDSDIALFTDTYSFCKKLRENNMKIMIDGNTKMKYFESSI